MSTSASSGFRTRSRRWGTSGSWPPARGALEPALGLHQARPEATPIQPLLQTAGGRRGLPVSECLRQGGITVGSFSIVSLVVKVIFVGCH